MLRKNRFSELSLRKYTVFIDSLLRQLIASNICCSIYRIPTSPVGYADDLAACTLNKYRMDQVMTAVFQHSCTWRYSFNSDKSAILVYGETAKEKKAVSTYRKFKLGKGKVSEKLHYDHVGIKSCVMGDTHFRTAEKIEKAKKVLNMSTNMGIIKGGLNLKTCCLIYWSVVFPTLTFGCEAWVIKPKDVELLQSFQRYAARRLQRLHSRSINSTCTACLGWMDICTVIKAKKLIFVRSIACMNEFAPIKAIFEGRLNEFDEDDTNQYDSPIKQILKISLEFRVTNEIRNMFNGNLMSKPGWKKLVWDRAWSIEYDTWNGKVTNDKHFDLIRRASNGPGYSIWWSIADCLQHKMKQCEAMVKLITHTSLLKSDDGRLRRLPFGSKMCNLCELGIIEDANHMIMQCHSHEPHRINMNNEINAIYNLEVGMLTLEVMLGRYLEGKDFDEMVPLWLISSYYIYMMYKDTLASRTGIG